ncbi:MAG: lasso peptide isopeptide bond-forming cyclase [Calothrix sp. FI2-JRJ7]|jgi:asparagine synthase (glutamine-hydrolysing)|nr:lasso peptide isopeptide bond-forming cyclase [Calothrix sp. FI2-JRJ7]
MSGIMGIYCLDGSSVERENLVKMVDTLAHRGPDGADIWVEGSVGFGHRMLWTTPESLIEKLPYVNFRNDLIITSDSRIDNREELIPKLQFHNCPPEKITDSQLILAAYEKWGEECPQHLLGDFAFVIWDAREQKLFCARDHMGVKPFYYYYSGKLFAFSSEIKALLCLQEVPSRLNEVRIADFLTVMMEDKTITSYQDILRLPPAHSMIIDSSGIKNWCYWSLDPKREIKLDSDTAYAEEFRKIFTEAVRCRMRSAFPIISQLSGGLDSSSVTCVARDILRQEKEEEKQNKLHTISIIFDKIKQCDERPFINAVIEQGGLIPHYIPGDELGPISKLNEIFRYEDEAFMGPSHMYPWMNYRATKELGLRISLDGFDGDTTVCHGTPRITELARQGDWKTCINEVKTLAPHVHVSPSGVFRNYALPHLKDFAHKFRWIEFFQGVQLIHKHFGISRKQLIVNHGIKPVLGQIRQWPRKHQKAAKSSVSQNPLVKNDFAESIGLNERIEKLNLPSENFLTVREQHWYSLTQGVLPFVLEQIDRCTANCSIEARHPFMDKRLIEFCLALPAEQKLSQGWGRMVMRRALEGILPEKVQWRGGKADASDNFDEGLLKRDRLLLDEAMSNQVKHLEKYIDLDFLQTCYQRLISGKEIKNDDIMRTWQVVVISLWLDYKQLTP